VKPPRELWRWMKTKEVYLHTPATKDKKADKESLARLVRTEPGTMPATEFTTPSPGQQALIDSNNKNNVKP